MAPAGVLIVVFIIAPFLLSLVLSFTNQRLVPNPNLPTASVGVANYVRLLGSGEFWQAFRNTFTFALLTVPLQSALALGAAMLVNSRLPARNVFRGIFFLPTVLTMVVVVVIWSNLYQINGFFNAVVRTMTFGAHPGFDWLANPYLAMPSIVLVSMWQGFGFQMVIYLAGLQSINPELYEAARVDGATRWQEFWAVTMPGLRNTHIFVLVTTTILALKLFAQVDLLTKGGPLGSTQTVVRLIYETGFRKGQVGMAAALSVIFFLVVLAISVGQRVFLKEDREVA